MNILDIAVKVANQILIMAIYISIGFFLTRIKVFNDTNTKPLSVILLNIVTPCIIIDAFQVSYSMDIIKNLLIAFSASVIFHIIFIIIAKLMYIGRNNEASIIDRFSLTFSNCGFMGIPLVQATLGQAGVLIGSSYLAVFNIFMWTQGYYMFNKDKKKLSLKLILVNPGILGILIAMALFIARIKLPFVISSTVKGFAALNTPVAMLLLGVYLARTDLLKSLGTIRIYLVSFVKLIVFPVMCIFVFYIFKVDMNVSLAIILQAACPCAAAGAIFADVAGKDSGYASSVIAISTVISLVSLPFISYVATLIL